MNFLTRLSARERNLVYGALALLALFAVWQFAVKPVLNAKQEAQRLQNAALRNQAIVANGIGVITPGGAQMSASKAAFDRSAIIDTARGLGLPISRIQPQGGNSIRVWFDNAPSGAVYEFVAAITQSHNVSVSRAQIQRRDGGFVSAQISLTPPQ